MESSETRRQSDTLPSMAYIEFDRVRGEGTQFHQRHQSMNRTSISTASPISPTTSFGPPSLSFPQNSTNAPNGYISPPESRRTSGNDDPRQTLPSLEGRQSLPSLHEALYDKLEKPASFPAPSPMQTPPLGPGSFSSAANSHPMPRSQPPDSLPSVQTMSGPSQMYSHPPPPLPPPPAPQSTVGPGQLHSHDYTRRNSQEHSRTLPPNPYAQAIPPPTIPAIRPSESYPPQNGNSPYQQPHPYQPSHHSTSPQYPPTPSPYHNGNSTPSQYPFPQHPNGGPPQQSYQHQQPPVHSSSYQFNSRDQGYQNHEPPQTSPGSKGGLKRNSTYGVTIERALSRSALRREIDTIKDVSSRLYHLVQKYGEENQSFPGGLDRTMLDFSEALEYSIRSTEAIRSCQQVFQESAAKEFAEANAQKMSTTHSSEYGGDDNHGYPDDTRSNGSQQPDAKKIRRGRAAPPGRCHSCHRAETPEWRRGPDGARTLCNACGLHYAKLTRKLNKGGGSMGTGGGQIAGRKAPNSPLP